MVNILDKQKFLCIFIISIIYCNIQDVSAKPPSKIVEGDDAVIEEFPSLVSIRQQLGKPEYEHYCGGTLISDKHILTAAHCVLEFFPFSETDIDYEYTPWMIQVYIGTNSSVKDENAYTVSKIQRHELYAKQGSPLYAYDIAVITLENPIVPSKSVRPMALPSANVKEGQIGDVAGWGVTDYDAHERSPTLKKASMTILDDERCSKSDKTYTPEKEFCAFNNEKVGFCNGDSGGPFIVNNEIVGIVSNSKKCSGNVVYVYTHVFHFLDWINEIVKND